MLLDSAFGDLWMPLSVFVMLGVTLGIGLSRLLRCTVLPVLAVQNAAESHLQWFCVVLEAENLHQHSADVPHVLRCRISSLLIRTRVPSCSGANKETTLIVSLLWIIYNMIPPYLLIHYTFIGRGSTLNFMSKCETCPSACTCTHAVLVSSRKSA